MNEPISNVLCPHCLAPRVAGMECPRCGVIYAKAVPIEAPDEPAPAFEEFDEFEEDPKIEYRLRLWAIPAALVGSFLIIQVGFLRRLVNLGATMWLHELGHAVSAWLCGFFAIALPWFTPTAENRSPLVTIAVTAAIVVLAIRSWKERSWPRLALAAILLPVQAFCTLALSNADAHCLVSFFGDGGAMVLGTLLMITFYSRDEGPIRTGGLRWGFLALGACAFMSVFQLWWAARTNDDLIPFGVIVGIGHSDPSVLVDKYGWTYPQLTGRYSGLGIACLILLAIAYLAGLREQKAKLR